MRRKSDFPWFAGRSAECRGAGGRSGRRRESCSPCGRPRPRPRGPSVTLLGGRHLQSLSVPPASGLSRESAAHNGATWRQEATCRLVIENDSGWEAAVSGGSGVRPGQRRKWLSARRESLLHAVLCASWGVGRPQWLEEGVLSLGSGLGVQAPGCSALWLPLFPSIPRVPAAGGVGRPGGLMVCAEFQGT